MTGILMELDSFGNQKLPQQLLVHFLSPFFLVNPSTHSIPFQLGLGLETLEETLSIKNTP